ncbi:response regulator [Flavobacterium sp.]|jgi:PAS domain S-box-containing protein|uniref:response regulator n=1 Tax=Flavobacterium sp. TaxID=239 RepID=UPI0037BEAD8C
MKNIQNQYARSLIEASTFPVVALNSEGKITDLNQGTINVTGLKREELINSNFSDYFKDPNKAIEVYLNIFDKEVIEDLYMTMQHCNGTLTDVLISSFILKDNTGAIHGVLIIAREVEKQKWAIDLRIANKELAFQNKEKEKRAKELRIANKELAFQNNEKEKRANELRVANIELAFQNDEKEKRANELLIANKELAFQNNEKEKRANELLIANKELAFQNEEKEKRANELLIANKELAFQTGEKKHRADELHIADIELNFQNVEKAKRVAESNALLANNFSLKLASQYSLSLIEASRDPLFTISLDGKIMDTNQASVRVTDVSKENLIGSDFIQYFTDPELAKKGCEEVFSKEFIVDFPLILIDGQLTNVLFNGSVFKDVEGKVIGAVLVARDITELKRAQNELIEAKLFAELATEIAEKALIKAEDATRLAIDSVKAKQQFLSNMSHEIRTPMNAIIGFTKVILKTELTAKQQEYLQAIKTSGDALIVLINDILDLAKVDSGKMSFEKVPFKMAKSIAAMLHLFEIKSQEKNIQLIKEYDLLIPEIVIGDPVRLNQIILNLVSNAVKFTMRGKIIVSVKLVEETDQDVVIHFSVSDTGIGIKETKIESIFENFQQASSGTSRIYGGTGLGLAIVKQLVEAQGGIINVISVINEGSNFSFNLTFQKTNKNVEVVEEFLPLETDLKDINVLVVEDIALNQLLMRTLLDDFGFNCDIAANGKIAIEKFQLQEYDIVLMDLQMPIMNGFEATEYIRNTLHSKIPIIALTADVTTVDLEKCKAVGMNDYVSKPVDERLLYNKIIGILKKTGSRNLGFVVPKSKEITRCINLNYLMQRTKSNPKLMSEMITLYLEQTPPLIESMRTSYDQKDWETLYSSVHKMIPSFSIVGINHDFEIMAKKLQDFANMQSEVDSIPDMVFQLENICFQACRELEEELIIIKNLN